MPNFVKTWAHCNFGGKSIQVFNFVSRSAISNIFMIHEIWIPLRSKFHSIRNILIFGSKFLWNEGIDNSFNVEYVLLVTWPTFWFFVSYLVVTAHYLVVTDWSLLLIIWWLLLVLTRYCSFTLSVWTVKQAVSSTLLKSKMEFFWH